MFSDWKISAEAKFQLFGVLTAIVCGLLVYSGIKDILQLFDHRQRAVESLSWPKAPGIIIVSKWTTHPDQRNRATIKYTYQIGAKEFIGDRVAFHSQRAHDDKLLEQYKAGHQVLVYYSPQEPALAVLEPGNPEEIFGRKMMSCVFYILLGGVGLRILIKSRFKSGA